MAQTHKVQGTATKVSKPFPGTVCVTYHDTTVAVLNGATVTLNSGGWRTATTKTRLAQFASEFCSNAFRVYQERGAWYVCFADGRETVPFKDGMSFAI